MITLKEVKNKKEIKSPFLRQMVGYTSDDEIQFLFVLMEDGIHKGIFIAHKDKENELKTTFFGSHYLLPSGYQLYDQALQKKLANLSK